MAIRAVRDARRLHSGRIPSFLAVCLGLAASSSAALGTAVNVPGSPGAAAASATKTAPAGADAPPAEFVRIAPGTFIMGSPLDEPGRFDDETQHPVTLLHPFHMCEHLVTQAEWTYVMGWNESHFTGDADLPVENVNWYDCVVYCNTRSWAEKLTPVYTISDQQSEGNHLTSAYVTWDQSANGYRLPTDAECEYACRAGSRTAFYNGPITVQGTSPFCTDDPGLDEISWYCANSDHRTHPVQTKPPNAWGLYDMAGNVQQWCWDLYEDLSAAPATDPTGPEVGNLRIWRGGGWAYNPRHCRCAQRGRDEPDGRYRDIGVRLCRNAP
jgi:formylglycine-generating enzyme